MENEEKLDEKKKKHLNKFLKERQNVSGLAMSYLIKQKMKKKNKGNYIDKFFKDRNLKSVKETFYIDGEKFTTNKLVEKENGNQRL